MAEHVEIDSRGVSEEFELLLSLYHAVIETKNLPSAFSAALQIVCEFASWDLGLAWVPAPGEKELKLFTAWHRGNPELTEFVRVCQDRSFPPDVGMPGRIWMRRKPEWTSNLAAEPPASFPLAPIATQAGIKAVLGVPVIHDNSVIAVILFYMLKIKEKDNRLVEVVSEVASQLGFALHYKHTEEGLYKNQALLHQAREDLETKVEERTSDLAKSNRALQTEITERRRMQEEVNTRARQQAAVSQIGQLALSGLELSALMEESCVLVARTLGIELCKILELLPDGQALRLRAGVGWKDGLVGQATVGTGFHSQAGYTLLSAAPVIVEDLQAETRFSGPPLLHEHGVMSGMSVTIPGRSRPFGVLGAHTSKRRTFKPDDVHFLEAVANVLSEAIERKTAEEEIRRAAAWFRSLITTTQDAVVSIDRRGCVVLFNAAAERIFGYAAEEIIGRKVNELMAEPYASEHDDYIARYETTGEARAIGRIRTVTAKRKTGELFPIELSVTKIAEDQNVQYAAFIRDISEKTRLQTQLVESERLAAIGTTAAKIGHELSNPLNGMSLTIQLLEQRLSREPSTLDNQVSATVKRLKNEISRLNQLAGQFRNIARREKYDFRPTELTDVIGDVIRIQAPHFERLGIQVENAIPPDLPPMTIDGDKIKQALLNLMKNAVEAMPNGGKITIEGRAAETGILLDITDTGVGIPLDIDAFEPFVTTKKDGTGVGLVIVRQIIVAHGGTVSYQTRPGEGTTFRIELPHR